jgi:hypothetical protein
VPAAQLAALCGGSVAREESSIPAPS